jgi:hypothetical protein
MAERSTGRLVPLAGVGLVVAAAMGLAACGSSSSPNVASLSKSSSDGSRTGSGRLANTLPTGDPTRLMDEWATCMRRHGDAGQADPTITADKLIDINWNPAVPGGYNGTNKGGQGNSGPGQFCRAYMEAAQIALRGGRSFPRPTVLTLLRFSECMQANGISDFPDPTSSGLSIPVDAGGDLNPSNPTFHNANTVCAKKTGGQVPFGGGTPPPGTIELDGGGPPG